MKLFARDDTEEHGTTSQKIASLRDKLRADGVTVVEGWGPDKGIKIPAVQHHTVGGAPMHNGGMIPRGNIYSMGMETVQPAQRSIEDAKAKLAAARKALYG